MAPASLPFDEFLASLTADLPSPFTDSAYLLQKILDGEAPMGLSRGSSLRLAPVALEKLALRGQLRQVRVPRAHILVTCFPGRHDYVPLLAPVIAKLRSSGRTVAVALPPGPGVPPHTFADVPSFGLHTLATPAAYARARGAFTSLRIPMQTFAKRYGLDRRQRAYLSVIMQAYCWQRQLFRSALRETGASVVFGIHFMLDPGIRGAIHGFGDDVLRPRTIFIQHGVYSHKWHTHDFHGADRVLLWSDDAAGELGRFPAPRPEVVVTGNPKLEWLLSKQPKAVGTRADPPGLQRILVLGTNGVPEREVQALQLAATSLPESATRTVLFRPHPDEPHGRYQSLLDQGILQPHQIDADPDIYTTLRSVDVVLGTQSTLLVEAVALGVPAVQLLPSLFELNWAQRGMASASTHDELSAVMDHLRSEPHAVATTLAAAQPVAEALCGRVAGAAKRAARAIESELDAGSAASADSDPNRYVGQR